MRTLALVTLMLTATGCAPVASPDAFCARIADALTRHAAALAADGGAASITTGREVIALTDAACAAN